MHAMLWVLLLQAATAGSAPEAAKLEQWLAPLHVEVSAAGAPASLEGLREFRVRWTAGAAASGGQQARPEVFSIAEQRLFAGGPARRRPVEIGPDQLLVAALDARARLRGWSVIPDPRVIRAEAPGPDGVLTGRRIILDQAEFFVSVPDDPEIVELRFYRPEGADGLKLVQTGSTQVRRSIP